MSAAAERVDLTNCDREPIHIPGAILPHGAMLVIDCESAKVIQVAGDTMGLLGEAPDVLLGRSASMIFNATQAERVRDFCAEANLVKPRHLLDPALRVVEHTPIDASVHKSEGCLIIEFERADPLHRNAADPLACVQEMLEGLDAIPSLQAMCQAATERVKSVTGYDRVMIYRFLPDDTGWVYAESLAPGLSPFLDLHYPASDIPKQARALYVQNWLRLITQIDYTPAPLRPVLNPKSGKPLDMSQATLRDVSPIHREYLRNMGVGASMSISIVREGKLWGLIACHHQTAKRLPRHLRAVCELFGAMFSLQLEARERAELFDARTASRQVLQSLMRTLAGEDDYAEGLKRIAPALLNYIEAGGLALRVGSQGGLAVRVNNGITTLGQTPNLDQISALTDWLAHEMEDGDGVFHTDRLGEMWAPAQAFADVGAGLLAISVYREPRDFILWFRPQVVETVHWGGDPTKPVEFGPNGARLSPRKSFEVWRETVRGRASAWLRSDGDAAFDLRIALLEIVLRRIDAAARERQRAHEKERLLMAELDHRVKNTLASIQALVTQTSRSAESLTDFARNLNRRIHSMARAHSLLSQSRWQGVSMKSVLREELDQYHNDSNAISVRGPDFIMNPKAAMALSLAIHELATNAAKYGALSQAGGQVDVSWSQTDDAGVTLEWRESAGPAVAAPSRRGFGSALIERALAIETGGRSKLHFLPTGVRCDIFLPNAAILEITAQRETPQSQDQAKAETGRPPTQRSRRRILVVEDSALVIMALENQLHAMGWDMVGPATRVAQAIALIADEPIDGALLDINLDGEMSWEVASVLTEKRIPFAFGTGYDRETIMPQDYANTTIINKPYRPDDLARCLRALVLSPPSS